MSNEETGFEGLGDAIAGYVAPAPFADGTEIGFRVLDAESKSGTSQKGRDWAAISLTLEPEADDSNENPKTIYTMLWKPNKDDDAKQKNRAIGRIKRFFDAVGYAPDGDPKAEEILGLTGRAVVKHVNGEDGSAPKNEIRYFITD